MSAKILLVLKASIFFLLSTKGKNIKLGIYFLFLYLLTRLAVASGGIVRGLRSCPLKSSY